MPLKLWLMRKGDEWVAFDGPDVADAPPLGQAIFSSSEDILIPGSHKWRMELWDGREGAFDTTLLS